ncbi:MAG: AAA family ATPase [Bacteroidaceae bacterium]|nr:AAA family ATPase [Bacteroidaceae bacterium]
MLRDFFLKSFRKAFPYELTPKQIEVVDSLFQFVFSNEPLGVYILRGYAGTGKTLLVSALVRVMQTIERNVILLAPTGRAAKVFSINADTPAYTIHKQIYRQQSFTAEDTRFELDRNTNKDTLFIVDEASMISAQSDEHSLFGSGNVLHDLLNYVYRSKGCRILFVGDNAQLPPVGEDYSPALQPSYLTELGFKVSGFQLVEVLRQEKDSGILHNATILRQRISEDDVYEAPVIQLQHFEDIRRINGDEIVETLQESVDRVGQAQTIVLTRSNKQANVYNQGIRSYLFGREEGLQRGDMVMIVRNNYFWTEQLATALKNKKSKESVPMDFIANGDIAEVLEVSNEMELYGLHFADVSLRFPDYNDFEMHRVRVVLDTLTSDGPALSREMEHRLFLGVSEDYADERSKKERMKKIRLDPNYNALQIKYAYAITCHKAQGGQWKNVFLDQGWLPADSIDVGYYRWLYTAFTRPTEQLNLLAWPQTQSE